MQRIGRAGRHAIGCSRARLQLADGNAVDGIKVVRFTGDFLCLCPNSIQVDFLLEFLKPDVAVEFCGALRTAGGVREEARFVPYQVVVQWHTWPQLISCPIGKRSFNIRNY